MSTERDWIIAEAVANWFADETGYTIPTTATAEIMDTIPPEPVSVPDGWKDHDTRQLVDELRDIAVTYHATEQLRERIAHVIHPLTDRLTKTKDETNAD